MNSSVQFLFSQGSKLSLMLLLEIESLLLLLDIESLMLLTEIELEQLSR